MKKAHSLLCGALLALWAATPAWGQQEARQQPVDVSGTWEISSETPRGTMTRTVTFEQDGSSLTGTMEGQQGSVPIEDGAVEGNTISFSVVFSRGDRSFTVVYRGTVDGDTAKGTFETSRGEVEWTGKRVEKRE